MIRFVCSLAAIGLLLPSVALGSPKGVVTTDAAVTVYPDRAVCPLHPTLFGVNINTADKARMAKPEVIRRVRKMGIKSCRFPNGCQADLYNWKSPGPKQATVEDFLVFCDAIDAEPYYTINLQGGTEGLKGPAPKDTPLDESIKYQHLMPNPCGYTNYYYGTLPETLEFVRKYTVDRALAGKTPILHYEMGNENWGQSRTDWPPEIYARTVEVYAKAMRGVLEDAKKDHPELRKLNLYLVAVGYPVMGNNMKMVDSPDRQINLRWTSLLNKLHDEDVIDAVQEHYYPYASANGGALVWAAHNLHNIISARKNIPDSRLGSYHDPKLAYNMPMEHTEWNVKCWGPRFSEKLKLVNGGFEDRLDGWNVTGGGAQAVGWAARRGDRGVRVVLKPGDDPCEISQTFDRPEKALTLVAGVWIRADEPDAVKVLFRQINDGENKGKTLGEWGSKLSGTWERVVASAKMLPDTKKVELVLRVEKPGTVYLDEAKLYYTTEERGQCPISATTFEQQLFCVDALREMAEGGCPRAHLHHLFGDYPCGAMTGAGLEKDNAKVFEFFSGAYGDRIVEADCKSGTFAYYSSGNPWATDFNALAPDRSDVPMLACMASRRGDMLYLLLLNRSSDRTIDVKMNLNADPADGTASVRTLSGEDIDVAGARLEERAIKVTRVFSQPVEPYSAQIISVKVREGK